MGLETLKSTATSAIDQKIESPLKLADANLSISQDVSNLDKDQETNFEVVDAASEQKKLCIDLGKNVPDGVSKLVSDHRQFDRAIEATKQFDDLFRIFKLSDSLNRKVQVTGDLALAQSLIYIELLRQKVSRDINLETNMVKHLKDTLKGDYNSWRSLLPSIGVTTSYDRPLKTFSATYSEHKKMITKVFATYDEFEKFAEERLDDSIKNELLYNLGLRLEPIHFPVNSEYSGGIHLIYNSRYIDANQPNFSEEPISLQLKLENMNFELFYLRIISQYFSKLDKSEFNKSAFYSLLSLNKDLKCSTKIVEQVINTEKTFEDICQKLGEATEIIIYVDKKELDTEGSKAKEFYDLIFSKKEGYNKLNMGILKITINKDDKTFLVEFQPFLAKKGLAKAQELISLQDVYKIELIEKVFNSLNLISVLTTESSVFNDDRLITLRYTGIIEDCITQILSKYDKVGSLVENQPLFKLSNKLVSQTYPIESVHNNLLKDDILYKELVNYIGAILYAFDYRDTNVLYDKIFPVMYNTLRMDAETALDIIINISDTRLHDIAMCIFKTLVKHCLRYANISKQNSIQHNSKLAMDGAHRFYTACENALDSGVLTQKEREEILALKDATTTYLSENVAYYRSI